MCGVEYFGHPWEFGPRKAKELLLTGDSLDADDAHALGMVSKVFPTDQLSERTLEFAARIAKVPTIAALLIKESVNQNVDAMGFSTALDSPLLAAPAQPLALGGAHRRPAGHRHRGVRARGLAARPGDPARRQEPSLTPGEEHVDIDYPPEAESFRQEIKAFLSETLPADWSGPGALPAGERDELRHQWRKILRPWPGRGLVAPAVRRRRLSAIEQAVLAEEFARGGAPERDENDMFGIDLLGNAMIALGTEEQKRHFLPRILSGEDRWCQGSPNPRRVRT